MPGPLCFVLMPFGRKADAAGRVVDFDQIHASLIAPAIVAAGLEPLRADEEMTGGIAERGPSSETCAILGRVYKDRWDAARTAGEALRARGLLQKAIDAYLRGFETDWRDAYPGINALTLMEVKDPPDPRRERLAPVVRYAVERRMAAGSPDYWDHATLVEIAVLMKDEAAAVAALADALASVREPWEPETTARNLGLIRDAWARRGEEAGWATEVEAALQSAGGDSGSFRRVTVR